MMLELSTLVLYNFSEWTTPKWYTDLIICASYSTDNKAILVLSVHVSAVNVGGLFSIHNPVTLMQTKHWGSLCDSPTGSRLNILVHFLAFCCGSNAYDVLYIHLFPVNVLALIMHLTSCWSTGKILVCCKAERYNEGFVGTWKFS